MRDARGDASRTAARVGTLGLTRSMGRSVLTSHRPGDGRALRVGVGVGVGVVYGRRARVGIARIARQLFRARSRTTPRVVVGVDIVVGIGIVGIGIGVETAREASSRDGDGGVAVQGAR